MLRRFTWFSAGAALLVCAFMQSARAEEGEAGLDLSLRTVAAAEAVITADGSPIETPASHMVLMDYATGTVLAQKSADRKMYPSSMTKIMTLYMIFERMKQGTLTLSSQFTVSEKAWRIQGSKMFVPLGGQISLEDLIRGIAIQSGNDACVVVAEGIAGSEAAFASLMNDTAKKIGMTNTNFVDASGWPNPAHVTTAHDLAVLGASLIRDFPEYYHYVSEREFTYHGIRQFNRNLLLNNTSMHVDGIKTGHTDAAGYGITLSAKDPATGRRLVLVVNGLNSEAERAAEGERLLSWGFHNFDNRTIATAGKPIITANVWGGQARNVVLVAPKDIAFSIPKLGRDKLKITASYDGPIAAPIEKGKAYGKLTVTLPSGTTREYPLVAAEPVENLSSFGRIGRTLGF